MTEGQRKASELAQATCARIAEVAPAGLHAWLPQLKGVHRADAAAYDAIEALERHDGPGAGNVQRAAVHACDVLVKAWKHAADGYVQNGCPSPAQAA